MNQYLVVFWVCQDADTPDEAIQSAREAVGEPYWPAFVGKANRVNQDGINAALVGLEEYSPDCRGGVVEEGVLR